MKVTYRYLFLILVLSSMFGFSQSKVGGYVKDEDGNPVPFANVYFKGSTIGTITNEEGRFYLESEVTQATLIIALLGYANQEFEVGKKVMYNMEVVLQQGEQLNEVTVYTGKTSKRNNPAIDILKKIWERKRRNGLSMVDQYSYDKYEKVEFDLNTIDSNVINSNFFKGLEFMFEALDTNQITGKTYLPFFINEISYKVYGDNEMGRERVDLLGNKNSGFEQNQNLIEFVKDLYPEFNIYDNYLKFFDKSFNSPLSRTGVQNYNYVLNDSTFIDNKWSYNIIFYPRRPNELTFKGDFWVNDTTFAIQKIRMAAAKGINVNWVKEIYIEQEFEVVNDSVFLLKRDHLMADFSLRKKEESRGIYGKRTTLYGNYKFDEPKPASFYNQKQDLFDTTIYTRDDAFWEEKRLEALNKDEKGIYTLLDTLVNVPKFKRIYNITSILATGYIDVDKYNIDLGPIQSFIGQNDLEGLRLRLGGRTYRGQNDLWRLQGYTAYGFKDSKFKYGADFKWMVGKKDRIIVDLGHSRDLEQNSISFTRSNDALARSLATSAVFATGDNTKLFNINRTNLAIEGEFMKDAIFRTSLTYKTLKSGSVKDFQVDYFTDNTFTATASEITQTEVDFSIDYTPKRRLAGHGVERWEVNQDFARYYVSFTKGFPGMLESDFNYEKLQFLYKQPILLGGFGRFQATLEAGKIWGTLPVGLLAPVPANQTFFNIFNTFGNLDYYEFTTDEYISLHMEHNFNGRLFSRVPWLRKYNLREILFVRGVYGDLDEDNIRFNVTDFPLVAPNEQIYYEYGFGIGNILKLMRIDFSFRGNYLDMPDARPFTIKWEIGLHF
ncbi:MAG: DUF5686 family protein [Flavobacteriaceae bacterium]|nr:DUF5686 family protein [Flavobacteriaceae bacterium]